MEKETLRNWNNEIVHNLIMLKYANSKELENAFKENMDLLNPQNQLEMINHFLKNTNRYNEDLGRSGRYIELQAIFQDLISYLGKQKLKLQGEKTGFNSTLSQTKIHCVYKSMKEMKVFFHKVPEPDHFEAALTDKILPPDFEPIVWKPSKWALYEFLERISRSISKRTGKQYIPDKIKKEVIPNLFHDEKGEEIFLGKPKSSAYSNEIHFIEEILKKCT